jgi:hypothetical protein
VGRGEIDLLIETHQKYKVIIEVRGRARADYAPAQYLAGRKRRAIRRAAQWLAGEGVARLWFMEMVGPLPATSFGFAWLCVRFWWGDTGPIRMRLYELEG